MFASGMPRKIRSKILSFKQTGPIKLISWNANYSFISNLLKEENRTKQREDDFKLDVFFLFEAACVKGLLRAIPCLTYQSDLWTQINPAHPCSCKGARREGCLGKTKIQLRTAGYRFGMQVKSYRFDSTKTQLLKLSGEF